MEIFSRFKRRKEEPKIEIPVTKPEISPETTNLENIRAKIDLLITQLESLRIQNEILNERIDRFDKTLNEIYVIAKRSQ